MSRPDPEAVSCTVDEQFTVFGAWRSATLPRDLPAFFQNGVFINRDNKKPMEQDAYSVYLALKALDKAYGTDHRKQREKIVVAVLKRMHDCGGFWSHGEWTGAEDEIHMRYTAAAIRLLVEAADEGLLADASVIIGALKRHLSFSEPLNRGTWFLHDSFEQGQHATKRPPWARPLLNNVWGSSQDNCLVLNTHLDTLITILDVLQRVHVDEGDRQFLVSQLQSGVAALKMALRPRQDVGWHCFAGLDSFVRSALFRTYSHRNLPATILRQILWQLFLRVYVPVRQRLRSKLPGYDFPDGYLERDIGLRGISFEYHLVNVHDLAKFVLQAKASGLVTDAELIDRCEDLIDRGIDYAVRSNYWHFLMASTRRSGWPIQLCEAILARLAMAPNSPVPQHWVAAYCTVRRALPPTAAILGYDPLIVGDARPRPGRAAGMDYIRLRDGRALAIDVMNQTFDIRRPPKACAGVSG